jgi:glycolate oxidase FAD binding subunit
MVATVAELASVMRDAAGLAVVARGAGTKSGWGPPPRACDLVVDLRRLDRIIDHAAGDMVVQVEAGVPLARLAAVLAEVGQQFAIDVPSYDDGTVLDGTVGGALAVGLTGPRRLRYGAPRDLLLGVTMVRADGVVASAGGRVVKNVAGYDLGKLLCGSYGTLGIIATATLRLHPLPAAVGYVTVTAPDPAAGYRCTEALLTSQLAPSAVELDRPDGGPIEVAALFEGTPDGVATRCAMAADLTGGVVGSEPPAWFARWPGTPTGTLVRVTFPPAGLVQVLDAVAATAATSGLPAPLRGSPGVAELYLGLPPDAQAGPVESFLSALRDGLAVFEGAVAVVHSPIWSDRGDSSSREPGGVSAIMWGPPDPGALALMRRVKYQFDPEHRLAPGRFVGGI